jgi:hypothetical protein
VTALAIVVGALVDDDRAADDRVGAEERDGGVCLFSANLGTNVQVRREEDGPVILTAAVPEPSVLTLPALISEVLGIQDRRTEVTNVPLGVLRATVVLAVGVEVGTSRGAAVAIGSVNIFPITASAQ